MQVLRVDMNFQMFLQDRVSVYLQGGGTGLICESDFFERGNLNSSPDLWNLLILEIKKQIELEGRSMVGYIVIPATENPSQCNQDQSVYLSEMQIIFRDIRDMWCFLVPFLFMNHCDAQNKKLPFISLHLPRNSTR